MSGLEAGLVALSHARGTAVRRGNFCHRLLTPDPITMVLWQLGGEPHALAASGYGRSWDNLTVAACPRPLNRTEMFTTTIGLASWFNAAFEAPWDSRTQITDSNGKVREQPSRLPQVLMPNPGTVTFARKLARRLSYLPITPTEDGPPPADPALVRFGRHLQFLTDHCRTPGQQILVDAVSLLEENWVTAQTVAERANLAAFAAWVSPRKDQAYDGYRSALLEEGVQAGPAPAPSDEYLIERDINRYTDASQAGLTDAAAEAAARVLAHYRRITDPAWTLTWDVWEHESSWPVEPTYVPGRVNADLDAYTTHMQWMNGPAQGRRRTRQTVRQTIPARRRAEAAASRTKAETVCSDPPRLIPYLLDHKAVTGVIERYEDIKEIKPGNSRRSAVPRVVLRTDWPCLMPVGKELWWTDQPGSMQVTVERVAPAPGGTGSVVRLRVDQGARAASALNRPGARASFSVLTTKVFDYTPPLPDDPFTHIPSATTTAPDHLEDATSVDTSQEGRPQP